MSVFLILSTGLGSKGFRFRLDAIGGGSGRGAGCFLGSIGFKTELPGFDITDTVDPLSVEAEIKPYIITFDC